VNPDIRLTSNASEALSAAPGVLVKKPASLLAAILTASGLMAFAPDLASTAPAAGTASRASHPAVHLDGINWHSCNSARFAYVVGFGSERCATLRVPMNYAKPHGKHVRLALTLLRHTSRAKHYQGVMLSNPGGPGGSGIGLGSYLAGNLPQRVSGDYDWISWDPRGVGASRPAISCDRGYFKGPRKAYRPTKPAILHYWLKRSKAYADSCERHYPRLLRHITTVDTVRDMESIRKAVHAHKINYYGYSYGTYLGQVYSTLHPTHVRRMVLDSNVDPRHVWYQANLDQDKAFDRAIGVFFKWVAKYHKDYELGATEQVVEKHYYETDVALAKHPKGVLGSAEWEDAFESAAYEQADWPGIASAWRAYAVKGHVAPITSRYKDSDGIGSSDNEYAVYNAVQCTDAHWPSRWHRWRKDNTAYYKKYPFLTWGNAWYNAPCLYWGAKAHKPMRINGKHTKSMLLIDETRDAATPYRGSLEVRKLYPHSSLIAEPGGTSHANSLSGIPNPCVDSKIATYLANGHRPKRTAGRGADATCAPLPPPKPSAAFLFARPMSRSPYPAR
jgi:pimeloyl-ACP methyl ester carboxylesterase